MASMPGLACGDEAWQTHYKGSFPGVGAADRRSGFMDVVYPEGTLRAAHMTGNQFCSACSITGLSNLKETQYTGMCQLLSCCVNAACVALMDAAVPMKCLVSAVTCALTEEGQIVLDPDSKQEKESSAVLTFAFDSRENNVITCSTKGCYTPEQYQESLSACREASKNISSFFRQAVEKRMSKELKVKT
ncbi:Exosome component 5 [Branchiostoma belcheri]|nr:Exosome component 5 [Branchiostoma belcheri]